MTEKQLPCPGLRTDIDLVIQHPRDAVADRKSQPQSFFIQAAGIIQAVKLLENCLYLGFRYTNTGVPDTDPQLVPTQTAAQQHAAGFRVVDGVGEKVLQNAV